MHAKERGRRRIGLALGALVLGGLAAAPADAQLFRSNTKEKPKDAAAEKKGAADNTVKLVPDARPVSPNDAVAIVNGEAITRQQLADETVARKGKEILETMVAGKIIDQAVNAKKMKITSQEVEEEIASIAGSVGVNTADWLRTLDKERGISPLQYKRDIIYRVIALRKLAEPRVQVTDQDVKKAYEAQYGERLNYRMIITNKLQDAKDIWTSLNQNPAGFEKIARDDTRSVDTETKPIGGLALMPMSRHAFPLNLSQEAFRQLVDGDPDDKDPAHKPKDGDITGPIMVSPDGKIEQWVILKREKVDAARKYDPSNTEEDQKIRKMIYDMKLQEMVQQVYNEMQKGAAIENRLTGEVHLAEEATQPALQDGKVQLMSNAGGVDPNADAATTKPTTGSNLVPKPQNAPPKPDFSKGAKPEGR